MRSILKGALVALTLVAASAVAQAHDHKAGEIKIVQPWSRATPGGAEVGAGYLTIENTGKEADRLTGGSTPIAEMLEVHSMTMEGNMMKMRKLDGLDIPAGGSVALKPGGNHIMLMGLKQPIEEGKPFTATLTFEKAGDVEVEFTVEPIGAKAPSSGQDHGDHGEMPDGPMEDMDPHAHH
ncbi:copper chaperone PCu(A)C [Methyloligella solikamskensis]|uniref:Copper chaperone PCu(A)C n=1 Tax=Methyloligella solikamskensis TaxID=1177756 RepID=A0ABW3JD32_9HYPH